MYPPEFGGWCDSGAWRILAEERRGPTPISHPMATGRAALDPLSIAARLRPGVIPRPATAIWPPARRGL